MNPLRNYRCISTINVTSKEPSSTYQTLDQCWCNVRSTLGNFGATLDQCLVLAGYMHIDLISTRNFVAFTQQLTALLSASDSLMKHGNRLIKGVVGDYSCMDTESIEYKSGWYCYLPASQAFELEVTTGLKCSEITGNISLHGLCLKM